MVLPGQWFCHGNHDGDHRRTYGTVWQHKNSCPVCYRSAAYVRPPQPPPRESMAYGESDEEVPPRRAVGGAPVWGISMRTSPTSWSGSLSSGATGRGIAATSRVTAPHPRVCDDSNYVSASIPALEHATPLAGVAHSLLVSKPVAGPTASTTPQLGVSGSWAGAGAIEVRGTFAPRAAASVASCPLGAVLPDRYAPNPSGYNTLLHTSLDRTQVENESRYIGPTGIKLPLRLARCLQPANWCTEPPDFHSCLEQIAGLPMEGLCVYVWVCVV